MNKISNTDTFSKYAILVGGAIAAKGLFHFFRNMNKGFTTALIISTTLAVTSLFAGPTVSESSSKSLVEKKVVRAAFDLGSGDFKLYVAEVSNGKPQPLFEKVITVNLGADYNENGGTLTNAVQQRALKALTELRSDAERHGATSFSGIATAVFRKASNGPQLLDLLRNQCNIPLQILTQKEEGKLGFLTGMAIFPHIPSEQLLLLDIGSSSVQITGSTETEFYGADVGNSKIAQIFAENVRKQKYSQDTLYDGITYDEVLQLSALTMEHFHYSDWLLNKIKYGEGKVSYFGYTVMINTIEQLISKNNHLNISDLEEALQKLANPNFEIKDLSASRRQYRLFELTLIHSLMKKIGIEEIHLAINNVGSSPGLALAEEFWSE